MQFAQKCSFIHRRRPSVALIVADFYDLTLRCIRTGKPCMSTLATQYFTDLEITLTRSRLRLSQKQKLQSGSDTQILVDEWVQSIFCGSGPNRRFIFVRDTLHFRFSFAMCWAVEGGGAAHQYFTDYKPQFALNASINSHTSSLFSAFVINHDPYDRARSLERS
jgi:hypothetical protein